MFGRRGPAGLRGGFLADGRKPPIVTPPTGAFTTGTLGVKKSVGAAVGSNQYEIHRAVDPGNPLKQAVCGKWKNTENDGFITWTTDGWATQQSMTQGSTGDPVCGYAVNGDLVLIYMFKSGNGMLSAKINPGGAGTFGGQIALGIQRDRPSVNICRVGPYAGRIYVTGTNNQPSGSNRFSSCFWSDDHGRTWSRSVVMQAQAVSGAYPDGNYASASSITFLNDGTAVFTHATAPMTAVASTSSGYPYSAFAQRSLDGGLTWNTPVQIDDNGGILVTAKGGQSFNNVTTDGTRVYFFFTRRNESVIRGWLSTSDNGGLTWTPRRVVITPPSGYGCNQIAAACNDKVLVVLYHVIAGQWPFGSNPYRVFTIWSFDRGATFSAPIELTTSPLPWDINYQKRDAGEDSTGIMLFGDTAYLTWAEGTVGNLYTAQVRDIVFS